MSNLRGRRPRRLTAEERKSLTHGDFWIPEEERQVYKRALDAINAAGVPCVVAGAYAIYEHTGIYRKTKDLDLFFEPTAVVAAARALRAAGFVTRLEDAHWLAKATFGEYFVDLIYGMGNGVALIDEGWVKQSRPGILAAMPVRFAPPEELIWHRLFISERHRHDVADILHLILCLGDTFDWERLVHRVGPHWPLLLAQLLTFSYVYPGYRSNVPAWVYDQLLERAQDRVDPRRCGDGLHPGPVDLPLQLHDRRPRVGVLGPAKRPRSRSPQPSRGPGHHRSRRLGRTGRGGFRRFRGFRGSRGSEFRRF